MRAAETTVAVLRSLDEADEPRPSQRALYTELQDAQDRWRSARSSKARNEAMAEMLKISKAMDQA
jgi:hypothetical protein